MLTVKALLQEARILLNQVDVETPSLDARLLLQGASGLSQADMIASPDQTITPEITGLFRTLIKRRAAHEPVSRILGRREFYGRNFRVTPYVLDPRADTETLIDMALEKLPVESSARILDLGTGSGIIALTLLAERQKAHAVAVDISEKALAIAHINGQELAVVDRCDFLLGKWFAPVAGSFDLVISNPPYIESAIIPSLDTDVKDHDPHLALDGGPDGLQAYRDIAQGASPHLAPQGFVMVEIGAGQASDVTGIFENAGLALESSRQDLSGHIRCLGFTLRQST